MASISKQKNGRRTIQFVGADKKRRSIRLGKVSQRDAEAVKVKVERLVTASISGHPPDDETSRWVVGLDQQMREKLSRASLIRKREKASCESLTLDAFVRQYIDSRSGMKPNTLKNYEQTRKSLIRFFGSDRSLASITLGDCDDWHNKQIGDGYAPATISRNVKRAKQFFRAAVRKKSLLRIRWLM